ncbi:MAG: PLP-dependent aspartate aminotransferase family protein [Bryobacteraceae bacterium]
MSQNNCKRFKTLAIHAGQPPDAAYGAVMTPIYPTSTFAFRGVGQPGPFDYSRSGNPTRKALETCLAALESGTFGFAFGTGMAAEATLATMFEPGDHMVVHNDLYGGTYRLLATLGERRVAVDYVDLRDLDAVRAALRPSTRALWIESPTNPCMNLVDLAAVAQLARERGLLTICDNTFLSPYFQRPLELGIDIVVHSTTKYINGHSDVVGGAIVVRDAGLAERIGFLQNALGTCEAPFDCFLVLRGIKTLALRMEEHNRNALEIARWLERHPKISRVHHPGLPSHPQHALALRQMTGFGGTFSFRVRGGQEEAFRLLGNVKVFTLAESLGGVESLIEHPYTMTHVSVPPEVREAMGITPDLIRISVGIEDVADLIEDLEAALA